MIHPATRRAIERRGGRVLRDARILDDDGNELYTGVDEVAAFADDEVVTLVGLVRSSRIVDIEREREKAEAGLRFRHG